MRWEVPDHARDYIGLATYWGNLGLLLNSYSMDFKPVEPKFDDIAERFLMVSRKNGSPFVTIVCRYNDASRVPNICVAIFSKSMDVSDGVRKDFEDTTGLELSHLSMDQPAGFMVPASDEEKNEIIGLLSGMQ